MTDRIGVKTIEKISNEWDIPFAWALRKKKQYIAGRMTEIKKQIAESNKQRETSEAISKGQIQTGIEVYDIDLELELIDSTIKRLQKEFNSYETYLKYLNNPQTDSKAVTDEEIEIARNYPIWEFLPEGYGKGNINCPSFEHDDKHASAQVNKNFIYCHGCHRKFDALDLTMQQRGMGFIEAVKLLARS